MDYYPSKDNDRLNRRRFAPETIGGRVMINPRYPIRELQRTVKPWWCARCRLFHTFPRVRCDSGAFQDAGRRQGRVMPWTALREQLKLEEQLRWHLGDESFHFEVVFIYDDVIGVDEELIDGVLVKRRGTTETAAPAVRETLLSARYYASQRHRIKGQIGFVGQGVTPEQYLWCVRVMRQWMRPGDVFGFGGFCIWGRMPKRITPIAHETISRVTPLLKHHGIRQFHLLGVMYAPAIEWAARLARRQRVRFATDGNGPERGACVGGAVYDAAGRQRHGIYTKEQKYREYHPCDLALQNIKAYHEWAASL